MRTWGSRVRGQHYTGWILYRRRCNMGCVSWEKVDGSTDPGRELGVQGSTLVNLCGYRPCWTTYPKMEGWVSRHHDEQWPGGDFHCCGMKDCMKWRAREFDMARFRRGMGVFVQNKLWLQCILTFKRVWKRFGARIWYMDNVMDDILWIFGWKKRVRWEWKKKRAIRPVTQSILRLCPSSVYHWTCRTWFV